MYNIKQAAARAGVTVPVLRAWERRYGVVAPERSPSGYRQFDDAAVARVRTMRQLVEDGWSPSAAAAAILAGTAPVEGSVETGAQPSAASGSSATGGAEGSATGAAVDAAAETRSASNAAGLAARFVVAAAELDVRTIDAILDEMFSRGSFERVAGDLLFPALERLGDAWATGAVSVAGEHLASSAVHRRLALALEAAGPGRVELDDAAAGQGGLDAEVTGTGWTPASPATPRGRVIVGLPPGGRHELGALAFAVAASRAGIPVAYLGPDLPIADWVTASDGAVAAVIGVVTARDRRASLEVARQLRDAHPELIVAFGGRSAPEVPGFLRLGAQLPESVAILRRSLAAAA